MITGQVLAADSDTPLRRARVNVAAGTSRPDPVLTDDDGRFSVEVPGGGIAPFTVTITKGGFVTATASVPRKDVQAPLLVRLPRGAAISGIVVDQSGAPVVSMTVTASRVDAGAGAAGAPARYSDDDRRPWRISPRRPVERPLRSLGGHGAPDGRSSISGIPARAGRARAAANCGRSCRPAPKQPSPWKRPKKWAACSCTAPAESAADAMLRTMPTRPRLRPTPQVTASSARQSGGHPRPCPVGRAKTDRRRVRAHRWIRC